MAALPYNAEHYQPPLAAGCGLTWARRQWILESQVGLPAKKSMEKMEAEHLIEEVGAQLRSMMPWLQKK